MSESSAEEPFQACPFCNTTVQNIKSHPHAKSGTTRKLRGHIANHLIDIFITFALPHRDDLDGDTSERITDSLKRSTLHDLDGPEYDISYLPTPDVIVGELEDRGAHDGAGFERQWDFVQKPQPAETDPILDSFFRSLEQAGNSDIPATKITPIGERSDRSPRQKTVLLSALAKANSAVLLDNAEDVRGAIKAYNEACDLLK